MRTHSQIIDEAGGPSALARTPGVEVDPGTTKQWKRGDSIPAPYWAAIADAKLATLEELAEAASSKKRAQPVDGAQTERPAA